MLIDDNVLKAKAGTFVRTWKTRPGDEKAEAQTFLTQFLDILGIDRILYAYFEHRVPLDEGRKGFIDMLWKGQILIEMKSAGKDMAEAYRQAKNYAWNLPTHEKPKVILICDFRRFDYYDMLTLDESGQPAKTSFSLDELPEYLDLFYYLMDEGRLRAHEEQERINIRGAELMGNLHDRLHELGYSREYLEKFLVRLLFCLFAEDTGIFEKKLFEDIVRDHRDKPQYLGTMIAGIFKILNTPAEKRVKKSLLNRFAYINGGLFEDEIEEAAFDTEALELLLKCCEFDWKHISPAIFGSMFQSIMDKNRRRELGAHYTTEENILKLLKPLFLDDLWAEFNSLRTSKVKAETFRKNLDAFEKRLGRLKFLDPACGCGNFLVIAYRELRRLELEVLRVLYHNQKVTEVADMSQIDVSQFYGIELEEFPASIAEVALWLMDHLMCLELSEAFGIYSPRIPLTKSATIIHGNALTRNWEEICPKSELTYIMGNPPFSGARLMIPRQKEELLRVFDGLKNTGNLDYVTCWYKMAAEYIQGTDIECAFVSTNSICQGGQVEILWRHLLEQRNIRINFAHQTFKWSSEARGAAAVFCVIVGFSMSDRPIKRLYTYETVTGKPAENEVKTINAYLLEAPTVFVMSRKTPLCAVPGMAMGNQPLDDGNYLFSEDEKEAFLEVEPNAAPYFYKFLGGDEFINGWWRWCLYLGKCPPQILKKMPHALKRVEAVRLFRQSRSREATQKCAATPTRFQTENIPETAYLAIPQTSSERRRYIPIGFMTPDVLCSDKIRLIPNADLYHFGILTSTMHMAWTRYVCGRLKSDYCYSKDIVYNNFPWPEGVTDVQREKVMTLAQAVLDARAAFPEASLADLYDPNTMPPALAKAHEKLDRYVDHLYRKTGFRDDATRVAVLFEMYQRLTSAGTLTLDTPDTPAKKRTPRKKK